MIHKSNSFQSCSQSFNKIIYSQKFYLPFKGNIQPARVPRESYHPKLFGQISFIIWRNSFGKLDKYVWFLKTFYLPIKGNSQSAIVPREHYLPQSYQLKSFGQISFIIWTNTFGKLYYCIWIFYWLAFQTGFFETLHDHDEYLLLLPCILSRIFDNTFTFLCSYLISNISEIK